MWLDPGIPNTHCTIRAGIILLSFEGWCFMKGDRRQQLSPSLWTWCHDACPVLTFGLHHLSPLRCKWREVLT